MSEQKIRMVVFDMAGTTVNEDNLVYKTLQTSINATGFEFSLNQVLEQGAGKEKKEAIRSILSHFSNTHDEGLVTQIYDHFIIALTEAYDTADILPQPNATHLFLALKERKIITILNTGYDRKTACSILEKLNWKIGIEFDALVTASDVSRNRPDPDMIEFAMQAFNVKDSLEVAKVGDSIVDINEGQNAGCGLSIGITTGAHTASQLKTANPHAVINNLIDLLPVIDSYSGLHFH